MAAYITETMATLALSRQQQGPGASAQPWQSKALDTIVSKLQAHLDHLQKALPDEPADASVVELGLKANKLFKQCYSDIKKVAKQQIKQTDNPEKQAALHHLRQLAAQGAQHYLSSYQAGLVTRVNVGFEEQLPRHINERIATAPTPGVSVGVASSVDIGAGHNVGLAQVNAHLSTKRQQEVSVSRANDGNLFAGKRTQTSVRVGGAARFKGVDPSFAQGGILPLSVSIKGGLTAARKTGTVALAGSRAAMLVAIHAQTLVDGKAIGGHVGRLARFSGIEDALGNRRLAGVSEASLKRGYNNDAELAAGFQRLTGSESTVYHHEGKGPLGQLFTSADVQQRASGNNGQEKSVLSELFPDPLWVSRHYQETTFKGDIGAEATLGFVTNRTNNDGETEAVGLQADKGILSKPFVKALAMVQGVKAEATGAIAKVNVERTVRSPKLPHDIFNPALTQSPRLSAIYAQEYFSHLSPAEQAYALPLAKTLGFDEVSGYYQAMVGSLVPGNGSQLHQVDAGVGEQLMLLYSDFQRDIRVIDNFYLQTDKSVRQRQKAPVQVAISSFNRSYGAKLPAIDV